MVMFDQWLRDPQTTSATRTDYARSSSAIAPEPDRAEAIAQYRSRVPVYDLEIAIAEPIRRRAISASALSPARPSSTSAAAPA